MGPAHGVVVVGVGPAEVVDPRGHELGGLEVAGAVEVNDLVERAVDCALGARAVVADDVVDERVVEDVQVLEGVDQPADVVVGVLQEPGVDLHLAGQHRLELVGHVVPGRDLGRAGGQLGVGGDHPELLLAGEDLLAQRVPAGVEAALVLVRPLLGHVVRGVGGARGVVHEERLVGHERLLLADPGDGLVGHVLGEVVALRGGRRRLERGGALVDGGVVLVGLAADEAVEVLEARCRSATASNGPIGLVCHTGTSWHLPNWAVRVAVEPQGLGQRGGGVRAHRAVARRRGGDLGDAHPCRPSGGCGR